MIAALPFLFVMAVAGLFLYAAIIVLEELEDPKLMTEEEKKDYYGYGRSGW